jgi:hypothetical protein
MWDLIMLNSNHFLGRDCELLVEQVYPYIAQVEEYWEMALFKRMVDLCIN